MPLWSNNVDPYDRFKNQLESDKEKAVSCCHCQWSRCNMFVSKFTSPSIPILFRAIWSKQFIPQCLGSHVPGKHKKFGHTKSQLMENKCTDSKKKQAMHIKETESVFIFIFAAWELKMHIGAHMEYWGSRICSSVHRFFTALVQGCSAQGHTRIAKVMMCYSWAGCPNSNHSLHLSPNRQSTKPTAWNNSTPNPTQTKSTNLVLSSQIRAKYITSGMYIL